MKLSAVKVLISKYIRNNSDSEDEFYLPQKENNELYESVFKRKIVMGVIGQCDANSNGELDNSEIFKLSQKLSSFEEFLGVSFDGFLEAVDSDENWDEMNEEALSSDEIKVQNYQQKTDFAHFVLSTDSNISKEQFTQSVDLDIQIDENLVQINELMENQANLSDEQKANLNTLLAKRQELLASRDELEKTLLETGNAQTKQAILDMQKARGELETNQLETVQNVAVVQEQFATAEVPVQESYSGGGSSYDGKGSSGTDNKDDSVKGKTKEELQQELTTEEGNLSTYQTNLQNIAQGLDPEVSNAKQLMETSYEEYQRLLNEVSPDLASQLDDAKVALEEKQQNLEINHINIVNCTTLLTYLQANMSAIDSNIASCETALTSLNATDTSNFTPEQMSEFETRKKALNDKLIAAQKEKELLQPQIDTTSSQLETANNNVEVLTQEVNTAQGVYDGVQAQIDALENETISTAKENFTALEKNYNDKRIGLINTNSQNAITSAEKIKEIKAQLAEIEKQENEAQGKMGINGNNVELNGQNYDSVVPQEKINELLDLISNTKANNKGDHSDMCLAFSIWYGQYLEGKASASEFKQFLKPGNIPYGNGSIGTSDYDSDNKNDVLAKVAQDINNGHPAILQVGASNNTSRHYVLVVGLKNGASNPPKEDDLLIIDTYDGKLEGMGQYGTRDMITGKQCRKKYSGYQMYSFNI